MLNAELNKEDLLVIFDVLNVYDPNDISHVYPAMGEQEFLDGVQETWRKVFKMIKEGDETASSIFHKATNQEDN